MKMEYSHLDDAGLTPKGRMIVRFLILDSAQLVLAMKAFACGVVGGIAGAGDGSDRSDSLPEFESRTRAMKAEFARQIRRLQIHRLMAVELLEFERDYSGPDCEAIAWRRYLEGFLLETEMRVLRAQSAQAKKLGCSELAAGIDATVGMLRRSLNPVAPPQKPAATLVEAA